MARDEARHAGFLNKSMSDFGMQLDRFSDSQQGLHLFAEVHLHATYLQKNRLLALSPFSVTLRRTDADFPIFNFFENWCQTKIAMAISSML